MTRASDIGTGKVEILAAKDRRRTRQWLALKRGSTSKDPRHPQDGVLCSEKLLGRPIDQAVVDTGGFRFGRVLDLHDPNFLPGGAKYGDVPALLALGAPGRTWIGGETADGLALPRSQYKAMNAETNLTTFSGANQQTRAAAIEWLLAANRK